MTRSRRRATGAVIGLLVLIGWAGAGRAAGAGGAAGARGSAVAVGSAASAHTHPPLTDGLGNPFPAGPRPERIVSLSPNTTEILFAIGVDPRRIAGVTRYCDYPPEAKARPQIGGIIDPSLEQIQMIRPDVVIAARGNPVEIQRRIRDLGIPVFAVDDRAGLEGLVRIVADLTALAMPEDSARAVGVLETLRWGLAAFRAWSDSIPESERPDVYYADPENPEWTAGPGSHVDDLIRLAGGRNVVKEGGAWPQFSAERLAAAQPDWILLALPAGANRRELGDVMSGHPGWSSLRAIKAGRLCWVDSDRLLRPGPRILSALSEAAACLHSDRSRPDPVKRAWSARP